MNTVHRVVYSGARTFHLSHENPAVTEFWAGRTSFSVEEQGEGTYRMFHKSMRLPSFISISLDEDVTMSSPERKKTRRAKRTTPPSPTREIPVSKEPHSAPQVDKGAVATVDDPVEWERKYILDLLSTDAFFDWDVDFLPRLTKDVVAPHSCTSADHLYKTTILGALMAYSNGQVPHYVIETTLQLGPEQAGCSQGQVGCTPLRAAVWNTAHVEPSSIALLVQACPQAVHIVDEDGLSPLDHCLYEIVLGQRATAHSTKRLEALLQHAQPDPTRSPLIHLISLINSSTNTTIIACVRLLLAWDPSLATRTSKTTGCTPLHVAVRNNVSDEALVRELSIELEVFAIRNYFGDTVLHVVCATGAPDAVLQYVLEQTIAASSCSVQEQCRIFPFPHPVIWSVNAAGYTPVDLEWIRYVECGDMQRPLDARGVPRTVGTLYVLLLERMCQKARGGTSFHRRLQWIVQAALQWQAGGRTGRSLHVSALLGPHGPTLPRSIVDLLSSSSSSSVTACDKDGGGWPLQHPLHDVVTVRMPNAAATPRSCEVWQDYTLPLILPVNSRQQDDKGRFPLHAALWWPSSSSPSRNSELQQAARNTVVQALARAWPQATAQRDPMTQFYPFQAAACNPLISLDTIYQLLRPHPAGLPHR